MRECPKVINTLLLLGMTIMTLVGAVPVFGENQPLWWARALEEAEEKGYTMTTPEALKRLIQSGERFLLLDVRPDYEYRSGHIPQAQNFEFHLGDRLQIKPEKKRALLEMLGPVKEQKVVIYCRSFR